MICFHIPPPNASRSPSALDLFLGEGSPTKTDYRRKLAPLFYPETTGGSACCPFTSVPLPNRHVFLTAQRLHHPLARRGLRHFGLWRRDERAESGRGRARGHLQGAGENGRGAESGELGGPPARCPF